MPARCQYWKRQVLPLHREPPMVGTPPPGAEAAFNRSTLKVPEALIAFVKAELDSVKAPKAVHILAELPHSLVGKVQRREAKAAIHGACARASSGVTQV